MFIVYSLSFSESAVICCGWPMVREGEILDVIKDCEECVREFSFVTVWKLKFGKGGYAICTLDKNDQYIVYSIERNFEFAINNALWLDSIL